MDDKRIRPGVWIAVLASLAGLFAVVFLLEPRPRPANSPAPPAQPAAEPAPDAADSSPPVPLAAERSRRAASHAAAENPEPVPYIDGLVWGDIDLREARELMPDNLYWQIGAPTKDEAVLAEREAEKERRNQEYGRVLSGDAGEDEVRAYYDYRRRLSEDYLEFSEFMARRYRDNKDEQFVGLLELSMKLHAEKLAQLPKELEDALARARERARVREDWRRQQEEFGEAATPPAADGH